MNRYSSGASRQESSTPTSVWTGSARSLIDMPVGHPGACGEARIQAHAGTRVVRPFVRSGGRRTKRILRRRMDARVLCTRDCRVSRTPAPHHLLDRRGFRRRGAADAERKRRRRRATTRRLAGTEDPAAGSQDVLPRGTKAARCASSTDCRRVATRSRNCDTHLYTVFTGERSGEPPHRRRFEVTAVDSHFRSRLIRAERQETGFEAVPAQDRRAFT